jgi:hypothetical protein
MKVSLLLLSIAVMALSLLAPQSAPATTMGHRIISRSIHSGTGWILEFRDDTSVLRCGWDQHAPIPVRVLSQKQTDKLASLTKEDAAKPYRKDRISYQLSTAHSENDKVQYFDERDREFILQLFQTAWAKLQPEDRVRLQPILDAHPFLSTRKD